MALDGCFLRSMLDELKQAEGCHIEKIYQPSRDEMVLQLRKKGFSAKLLLSARAGASRVHFTEVKYENPATPPMFCMLARKHFASSLIQSVSQKGFERIIEFSVFATNEMGDKTNPKIVCELIGASSNIVLLSQDNKIIDAIKRSDVETAKRIIQPGAIYEYPQSLGKKDIFSETPDEFASKIIGEGKKSVSDELLCAIEGLSPLVCREMAFGAYGQDFNVCEISESQKLAQQIALIREKINNPSAQIIYDGDTPWEFSFTEILQYGADKTKKDFNSFSQLLDEFYFERENILRIKRQSADIDRLVNNLITRAKKRKNARSLELQKTKDRENLRVFGELIKANIHNIKTGDRHIRTQNFYDENLSEIEIKLDETLNASANAAKYFKEYKKQCNAAVFLQKLIEDDQKELLYLESVAESLERCKDTNGIREIREELSGLGYIKHSGAKNRKQSSKTPDFLQYKSSEGYKILVGKNNLQNDYITTKVASKNDTWFHTKGIHGAHVVVMNSGAPVSDETVVFAATLAAKNSKAANSSNVPVDYTIIKNVKKPAGARPGMVIYTTNKTVFVTPQER